MRTIFSFVAIALGALVLSAPSTAFGQAAALKIAVVDLQLALNTSNEGQRAVGQIEGFIQAKQMTIKKKEDEITKKSEALEADRSMMDPNAVAAKEQELASMYLEYQQLAYEAQAEMGEMEMQLRGKILERLSTTAEKIAKERGYDLVIEAGGLVYYKDGLDITSAVIEAFNAGK